MSIIQNPFYSFTNRLQSIDRKKWHESLSCAKRAPHALTGHHYLPPKSPLGGMGTRAYGEYSLPIGVRLPVGLLRHVASSMSLLSRYTFKSK